MRSSPVALERDRQRARDGLCSVACAQTLSGPLSAPCVSIALRGTDASGRVCVSHVCLSSGDVSDRSCAAGVDVGVTCVQSSD